MYAYSMLVFGTVCVLLAMFACCSCALLAYTVLPVQVTTTRVRPQHHPERKEQTHQWDWSDTEYLTGDHTCDQYVHMYLYVFM